VYDQIKTQLDTISELSDEQVAELQNEIVSQFESVEGSDPTPETVDAMTSLADSLDIVRGELSRREAQAEELAAKAAEATARVKGEAENVGEEMAMNETPADETPAEDAAPTEETPEEAAPVEETPAEETPAETAPTPEEEPGQVEEGTAEEEAKETPEEEKKEPVKASADSETEASTISEESSELSTNDPEDAEGATEAAIEAAEGSEASADSTPETQESTPIAPEEQEEQATVTAAADETFSAPADRQPVVQVVEAAPVAITAGADIPGYTAGSAMKDMSEVASAMEKRIHSLRRVNGGDGEQHIVASFTTMYPETRTLTTDAEANAQKIAAVTGPEALTASGGYSTPFEVKYDIFAQGSTNVRPVRDALPRFQADRGGIRFIVPPTFHGATYDSAVGIWTAATDASPGTNVKTSLTISAATETTVVTDAVTLQLQFGNLMTRAYPELIARHNELALVQHAREAEQNMLTAIGNASTAVTTTNLIGFGRDFLVQIRRAATGYRSRHRLDPQTRLKAIIPSWVYDAMAADLTLAMPGDGTLALSRSEIDGYLAVSNVDLIASLDATVFGSQCGSAL